MTVRKLSADELCRKISPEQMRPKESDHTLIDLIGQPRAKSAFKLALSSKENRFHLLAVTPNPLPLSVIARYILQEVDARKKRGERFESQDYCYLYNFREPNSPMLLTIRAGEGKRLKLLVENMIARLRREIPMAHANMQAELRKLDQELIAQTLKEGNDFLQPAREEWNKHRLTLNFVQTQQGLKVIFGIVLGPGQVIYDQKQIEAFLSQLPPDARIQTQENLQKLANEVVPRLQQEIYEKIYQKNEREIREKQQALVDQKYGQVIERVFDAVAGQYADNPKVIEFLAALRSYTADKAIEVFMPHTQMTPMGPQEIPFAQVVREIKTEKGEDPLLPFKVNLLIEGQTDELPPIVAEANPTYRSMFGWVERLVIFGGETERSATDHTKIHPGAFHKANGGFLVIDLNDILLKPTVLLGLMRTLRTKKIEMREPSEEIGQTLNGKLLSPEPIDLQLKVIGVINPEYYHDLQNTVFGQELLRHFGLVAFFDPTVNVVADNLQAYSKWIDEYVTHKGYLPITLEAKAAIIEYLMREAKSQKFFSSDLELLKNIIKEAYLYSRDGGAQRIEADHVKRAVLEKIFRLNLAQAKLQQAIADKVLIVEVNGSRIGQINGLVVYKTANYMFGIPQRFTVTTYRGEKGLINIAGNVGLAGPVFKKSVETIEGFFYKRYGREQTVTFEGRVSAEQIYGGIEGDSATMAMLLALISSLSEKPLRQDLAVTGAADQQGNIEAVGGVNQKIEGFFATCKIKGLTGTQGVVIPAANTNDLMLNDEVIEAVKKGQFHIYSVETIDDVVELLIGCPMPEIDERINAKFEQWREQELEERLKMELEIKEALRKAKRRKRFLIF